ncbi:g11902 [Coccomyxa elongata]
MGQNRRPSSGTQQHIPRGANGIIAPPGVDMAGLGANAAVSLKLEAVKKAVQKKSDTPPPHERQSSPAGSMGEAVRGASEGREGTPQETDAQRRKREDVLLANAAAVRSVRATLSLAFQRPIPEPARPPTGHDYMLQEMRWLAVDFGQERLWKRTAARVFAHAAAAAARKGGLGTTKLGEQMRAEAAAALAQEESAKSRKERMASNRSAGTSGAHSSFSSLDTNGVLHSPASFSDLVLTYKAGNELPDILERHIIELAEAEVILKLQEEREWEEEVEAARRAAAETAELKRQEKEAAEDAADGATTVDEEDQPLGLKTKRRKKGRLAAHILEDYVELDDAGDVGTPLGRRLGAPGRRPSAGLRPTSALSDRQLSDAEQRVRKRRRRDLEDEDYEVEPVQLRRVSARKANQVAASMDRSRGGLLRQPDKRGAAAGAAANKKAVNRMDSMGYGVGRRTNGAGAGGQSIPWSPEEERLLCAIVHEFGSNWFLVADVLATSCSMQGIYRSPGSCRYRFRAITTSGQGDAEPTEESALAAMQIDKVSARQLLHQSLPVPPLTLSSHQQVLGEVGHKARTARQQSEIQARGAAMQRVEAHPSYALVVAGVLATSQGVYRTPTELSDLAEAAATAQAQAAAAAAQAATIAPPPGAAMPPGMAGPPIAGGPMSPAQLPPGAGPFPPSLSAAMPPMQLPPGAPGFGAPGQPPPSPGAAAGPAPNGAAGADALPQMPSMPGAMPAAQPQPQQQLPPMSAGMAASGTAQLPNGIVPAMSGAAAGSPVAGGQGPLGSLPQPSAPGVPGSPAGMSFGNHIQPALGTPGGTPQHQQRPQISSMQLQQILQTNKLPDGRLLTPEMRNALIQKINGSRQAQQRIGMPPGMQASQAMQMHAAQNLVAQQQAAAARMQQSMQQQGGQPQLQGQLPGQPGGLPGQSGALPGMLPNGLPGMRPPGGYGLPGAGAPALPGGLSPAMMAGGQPRPPQQPSGLPPMAPGQMIAGGMAPPQMPGANMGPLPNLLAQTTASAKPPGNTG